jgi:hypothetical protein
LYGIVPEQLSPVILNNIISLHCFRQVTVIIINLYMRPFGYLVTGVRCKYCFFEGILWTHMLPYFRFRILAVGVFDPDEI